LESVWKVWDLTDPVTLSGDPTDNGALTMVRQARTYFAGAVSGVTLIGIAIALFVVLVSAQVFHQWPIAALGFGHNDSAVAPAKSLGGAGAEQTASAAKTSAATSRPRRPRTPLTVVITARARPRRLRT
jgi:hypothetical protein